MTPPLLSVTVLNYNYARYLPRCLDSILSQTFCDFEVILIDDCSPESPVEAVRPYLADPRVRFIRHEVNQGFAASLIEGTEVHSRGELLTVISADDFVLSPDAFSRQIEMLNSRPDAVLCFTSGCLVSEDGSRVAHHSLPEDAILEPEEAFRHFVFDQQFWAVHSGAIFRKSAYERAGGYRRDIKLPLDLGLWLKLSLEGPSAYCATVLYGYGVHAGQMSTSRFRANAIEVRTIMEDAAIDGERRLGLKAGEIRLRGLQRQLEPILLLEAFTGTRRSTLRAACAWLAVAPRATLLSRSLWIALLHTAVGDRGFHALQTLRGRLRRRA